MGACGSKIPLQALVIAGKSGLICNHHHPRLCYSYAINSPRRSSRRVFIPQSRFPENITATLGLDAPHFVIFFIKRAAFSALKISYHGKRTFDGMTVSPSFASRHHHHFSP
ncbi:uncharacterized protein ARMOST_16447 [Armillaria ostoyae]|uniref:Uncharacterized protein n=1 Tax=Armillaria ostoyae TaxID=47428 RepID=A0A284RW89_ARMOS|nr:uncharacterized protein ARMOST_16447 [Armillaria ostoyae]